MCILKSILRSTIIVWFVLFAFVACNDQKNQKEPTSPPFALSKEGEILYYEIVPLIESNQKESLKIAKKLKALEEDTIAQTLGDYYIAKNQYLVSNSEENLSNLLSVYELLAEKKLYNFLYDIDLLAFQRYYHMNNLEKAFERMEMISEYIFEPGLEPNKAVIIYGLGRPFQEEDKEGVVVEIKKALDNIDDGRWTPVKSNLHFTLGRAYETLKEFDKAEEIMIYAANQDIANGQLTYAADIYQDLSYIQNDGPKQAVNYAKKSIELLENTGYSKFFELYWRTVGHHYMADNQYENAVESYKKAIEYDELHADTLLAAIDHAYAGWAIFKADSKNLNQAIQYLDKSLELSQPTDLSTRLALERKKWIYTDIGDSENLNEVNQSLNIYERNNPGITEKINGILINNNLKFEEKNEKIKNLHYSNQVQAYRLKTQKIVIISSIVLGLLSLLLLVMYWQKTRLLNENKKRQLQLVSLNTNLKGKSNLIQSQNEKLSRKEEKVQEELKSKISLLSKNLEIFDKISEEVKVAPLEADAKKNILNLISEEHNKQVIEDIEKQFSSTNEMFIESLINKHPDLTSNNVKLCVYLKMGLSSKEISAITYTALQSVMVARSRLRKKLDLDESVSLVDYIKSF